ncbi:TPA: STM2901 family protein [Serratia marcescens]
MDTVEELGGTYFYKGVANLSAHELLFWIMIDTVEEQLGVQDVLGVAALILGDNSIHVPGKPGTATPGTSHASLFFRKHLNVRFKRAILPTVTKGSVRKFKVRMVNNLGVFVGRAVPVLGWVILANDIAQITVKASTRYNKIARGEDKLW